MQDFSLPIDFVDNYILKAKPEYVMVYLYAYRHKDENCSADDISVGLKMNKKTVCDAIDYWTGAGYNIFKSVIKPITEKPKFSSKELNSLFKNESDFEFLRNTVETILGKALTLGSCQTLAWMYKIAGLDISTIVLIANFAKGMNKPQTKYMENIAEKMLESGVKNYADAEAMISQMQRADTYQKKIKKMYGIERNLTQSEKQTFNSWMNEIKPKDEELMRAFEECVERTGKYSARYINAILVNWKNDKSKPSKPSSVPTPKATKFNNFQSSGNVDYHKLELEALRKRISRIKGEANNE